MEETKERLIRHIFENLFDETDGPWYDEVNVVDRTQPDAPDCDLVVEASDGKTLGITVTEW